MVEANYKWSNYFFTVISLGFQEKSLSVKPITLFAALNFALGWVLTVLHFLWGSFDVVQFVKMMSIVTSCVQSYVFFMMRCTYDRELKELLNLRERFWPWINVDEEVQRKINFWLKFSKIARSSLVWLFFILMVIMAVKAVLVSELPFECWVPNKLFLNLRTITFLQLFSCFFTVCLVNGVNCILLAFLVDLIIQFSILNYHLRRMDVLDEVFLKECVEHHSMLCRLIGLLIIT